MKSKKASTKVMQGKTQMEANKCKKPSKKIPVLWLVVVPKIPIFPVLKKISKIKMELGTPLCCHVWQHKDVPSCFSMERNKTLYIDFHPMTTKLLKLEF
jgi:hypothetical protein